LGLQIDNPPLYASLDYNLYLQCRKRWILLLRNVNFLQYHKRTHNMKRLLIRSHVHFNKCRTQFVALYTHPVYIMCVSFHTPRALNSAASSSTLLQFVTCCALYQPPSLPFHVTYRPPVARTTCSDPHY
jgi:hypothetical protein